MAIVRVRYQFLNSPTRRLIRDGDVERPWPANKVFTGNFFYNHQDMIHRGDKTPQGQYLLTPLTGYTSQFNAAITAATAKAEAAARNQFSGKSGPHASLGISIVQWRKSLDMISNRTNTLSKFAKKVPGVSLVLLSGELAARRRALRSLARSLNYPTNSKDFRRLEFRSRDKWRKRIKTPGDLFLEFWFGWSPLVNDVYSAVEVLQDPYPSISKIRAKGTTEVNFRVGSPPKGPSYDHTVVSAKVSVGLYAAFTVTNPNLQLANRLGLVNPATIALDAIPFSWLANWFVNLQQFTESLTFDAGISIQPGRTGRGTLVTHDVTRFYKTPSMPSGIRGTSWGFNKNRAVYQTTWIPKLRVNPPHGSLSRSLVSLSLLSQHMSKLV